LAVPLTLDPDRQAALDLAKRAVAEDQGHDAGLLLAAIYSTGKIRDCFSSLTEYLPPPEPHRPASLPPVVLAPEVRPIFQQFAESGDRAGAEEFFEDIGKSFLCQDLAEPSRAPNGAESRPFRA